MPPSPSSLAQTGQMVLPASFPALGAIDVEILVQPICFDGVAGSRPAIYVGHVVTAGTSVDILFIGAKVCEYSHPSTTYFTKLSYRLWWPHPVLC